MQDGGRYLGEARCDAANVEGATTDCFIPEDRERLVSRVLLADEGRPQSKKTVPLTEWADVSFEGNQGLRGGA